MLVIWRGRKKRGRVDLWFDPVGLILEVEMGLGGIWAKGDGLD